VIAERTLGVTIADARARLASAGIETPGLDARLLAAHILNCDAATIIGHPELMIDGSRASLFEAALRRRLRREPLAYILGHREFWSLPLRVTRDTLIPRPDTETLVEAAMAWQARRMANASPRILDLGTGSGCLLLALLVELPSARGVGVDISQPALAVARENAARLGVAERAAFVCGDWANALSSKFDLIVCNPPYIADSEWDELAADVRDFEPALALRGGADGLAAYRTILSELPVLLATDGSAFVEVDAGGAVAVAALAPTFGLQPYEIRRDLAGRARCMQVLVRESQPCNKFLGNQAVPV
jgi:release factor glutamine methyltransferase